MPAHLFKTLKYNFQSRIWLSDSSAQNAEILSLILKKNSAREISSAGGVGWSLVIELSILGVNVRIFEIFADFLDVVADSALARL